MSHETQTARHNLLIAVSERSGYLSENANRSRLLEFNMFGKQLTQEPPTISVDVFRRALEFAGKSSTLESQEKFPAKLASSQVFQSFDSFVKSDVFLVKVNSSTESLVGFARALVSIVDEGEDHFTTLSATTDYQRLAAAQDKLTDVVSKNENPLLSPSMLSMLFISNLIEKYEEKSNIVALPEPTKAEIRHQPESLLLLGSRGLEAAYGDDEPEYTTDMLIAVNPDYEGTDIELDSSERSFARGLEAAYDDDEPEYTTDTLVEVNPDYEKE